jgi:hypothetical protein
MRLIAGDPRRPVVVTLRGLQFLATHCHQLRHLMMGVNMRVPPEGIPLLNDPSESSLIEFHTLSPIIKDSKEVAELLGNMFPKLACLGVDSIVGGLSNSESWHDVARRLHVKESNSGAYEQLFLLSGIS